LGWSKKQLWLIRLALRGPYSQNLSLLREMERVSYPELREHGEARLQALLRHAHRFTTYYRRILGDHGVVADDGGVDLGRFPDLPLLDKSTLVAEFENLKSEGLAKRKWYVNASGGSTGEPVKFIQDVEFNCWAVAQKMQFDLWSGYQLGEPKAVLWGSGHDVGGWRESPRTRLGRWLRNEMWLQAFSLSNGDVRAYVRAINRLQPVQLLAYADSAYEFSRAIEEAGISVFSPDSIMTSAGTLHPHFRETIERVFKAPVFDRYGSREVGDIACECEAHEGLHVSAPWQHVEVLREDGSVADPGEEGEIVVTNLGNFAMPLIRYRIGDTGAWATGPCSCGRRWPLLASVTGRTCDTFWTRTGTRVDGKYFVHEFRTKEYVRRFRVVQESLDEVSVFLELRPSMVANTDAALEEIREIVRRVMGSECAIEVQVVPEIPPLPSGKYLPVISRVRGTSS